MILELFKENKKKFQVFFLLFLVISIFGVTCLYAKQTISHNNEIKANKIIKSISRDKDLSLVSMDQLESLLSLKLLSPATLGRIYQLMSQMSFLSGDKPDYNRQVAFSGYYYKQAREYEQVAGLYMEYLGRLYESAGFSSAKKLLDQVNKLQSVETYADTEITVNYYLNYADVAEMLGELELAKHYLNLTEATLPKMSEDPYYQLVTSKYHILMARLALLEDDFELAVHLLEDYSEEDLLGLPEGNQYVLCDFKIPYYELISKIYLEQGKQKKAFLYIDNYLENCEKCNFYMMEYRMLQHLLKNPKTLPPEQYQYYTDKMITLSDSNMAYISNQYCDILLDNISQTQNHLAFDETKLDQELILYHIIFISLYVILLIAFVSYLFFLYVHTDKVTGLFILSRCEKKRTSLEQKKSTYYLLILDIDDFKKVNDAYGDLYGKNVLRQVGTIIKEQIPEKSIASRYGEDEICIILPLKSEEKCIAVGENIRKAVETFDWTEHNPTCISKITLSGGLAKAENGRNPIRKAYLRLLYSKTHGKNQITLATPEE